MSAQGVGPRRWSQPCFCSNSKWVVWPWTRVNIPLRTDKTNPGCNVGPPCFCAAATDECVGLVAIINQMSLNITLWTFKCKTHLYLFARELPAHMRVLPQWNKTPYRSLIFSLQERLWLALIDISIICCGCDLCNVNHMCIHRLFWVEDAVASVRCRVDMSTMHLFTSQKF